MTPRLDREGDVFVMNLGEDENRFNPDWMSAVADCLDEATAAEVALASSFASKQGQTLAAIKERMYADPLAALRDREKNALRTS